jgi:hypothetical protein
MSYDDYDYNYKGKDSYYSDYHDDQDNIKSFVDFEYNEQRSAHTDSFHFISSQYIDSYGGLIQNEDGEQNEVILFSFVNMIVF